MSFDPPISISPEQWKIIQRILKNRIPTHTVWAFGSRATGKAKPFSDLDLAIIGEEPLGLALSAALSHDFSASDLPWKVDIVDWATTSPIFQKIIEQDKVVVQA